MRNIYIIEHNGYWPLSNADFNKEKDLVLTLDFALKHRLRQEGINVEFLDHLQETAYMEKYNFEMHDYLGNWYKDVNKQDIFQLNGLEIGNAFLLNLVNEVSYYVHFLLNLLALKKLSYGKMIVCMEDKQVLAIIRTLFPQAVFIEDQPPAGNKHIYYFPISKWMHEKISARSFKDKLKSLVLSSIDIALSALDLVVKKKVRNIFIQNYFPTRPVINKLKEDKNLQLIVRNYSGMNKGILSERRISFNQQPSNPLREKAALAYQNYLQGKQSSWEIEGIMVSDLLKPIIAPVIKDLIAVAYHQATVIKNFFGRYDIKIVVPITDLWMENRLIMNYCKKNNIPVFMIINGLLIHNFEKEGRDADLVNSYGQAMKEDYFYNADNIVCLGDPRMDSYVNLERKEINRETPHIIIGAAGYSPVDLNSYLAYEFDFMYDILSTCAAFAAEGKKIRVTLKIRMNNYIEHYKNFVQDYFPQLDIDIIQSAPFQTVIKQADLYITFFSQTVFEASILGIPAIYYKNDTQVVNRPFNQDAELVTACNPDELKIKMQHFFDNTNEFDAFLKRTAMENYIGPLDGRNTERNVRQIYDLLK